MFSILKTFGMGLLYTILSPLIALVLIGYFLYTFIAFIVMFFIDLIKFFKGKSITDELPIEINAKKILKAQEEYEAKMRDAILNNQNIMPNIMPVVNPVPTPQPQNNVDIPTEENEPIPEFESNIEINDEGQGDGND